MVNINQFQIPNSQVRGSGFQPQWRPMITKEHQSVFTHPTSLAIEKSFCTVWPLFEFHYFLKFFQVFILPRLKIIFFKKRVLNQMNYKRVFWKSYVLKCKILDRTLPKDWTQDFTIFQDAFLGLKPIPGYSRNFQD